LWTRVLHRAYDSSDFKTPGVAERFLVRLEKSPGKSCRRRTKTPSGKSRLNGAKADQKPNTPSRPTWDVRRTGRFLFRKRCSGSPITGFIFTTL